MGILNKLPYMFCKIQLERLETLNPSLSYIRCVHSELSLAPKIPKNKVAVFWDLDNKLPNSFPPYEAARKLNVAAASFGSVHYMVAYANRHAFSFIPQAVREQRKERKLLDILEKKRVIKPAEPYLCRVCGRKFHTNEKLVNHFKELHEREQKKRLSQIESSRGNKKVKLVAKYSMKMEKYKKATRDVLTPKVGYGLADELKRAGFLVKTVSNKPQAADNALKEDMIDIMDKGRVECLMLVSDDSGFIDVLKDAKLRGLKTVVVGDMNDGVLKRIGDVGFSWKEILMGKAKKEAVSAVGKWKDRDVLKRLEWTYKPGMEKKSDDLDCEDDFDLSEDEFVQKGNDGVWWDLDSDAASSTSLHGR